MIPVTKALVLDSLKKIGLKADDTVMVHTSLSSVGYVCGGAQTVIEALIETVGAGGTIMMPTQSWKNLDPETGVHWDVEKEYWDVIRENWPAYDPKITPTNTMGAVAEMFRSWPGVLRSSHPARSVAAWGKNAAFLTENHDLSDIFGETSPLARLYKLDASVLLIGVDYDKNTSLHLADARANYPSKHNSVEHSAVLENGKRVWKAYETLFVDGEDFIQIGEAFEKQLPEAPYIENVRTVTLGNATLRLMKMRSLVDFAVKWIEANRK